MLSTFDDKKLLAVKSIKKIDGEISVLENPDGRTFSCQADGSVGDRDAGANGSYERCRIAGNLATFQPVPGKVYTFGFVVTDAL